MVVRPATDADLPLLAELMDEFRAERKGGAGFSYDQKMFMELLAMGIARDDMLVLILSPDRGFLFATVGVTPYSPVRIAQELVWYTRPAARGHGIGLFRHYLRWAQESQAAYAFIALPQHSPAMERFGFSPVDIHYMKRLPAADGEVE